MPDDTGVKDEVKDTPAALDPKALGEQVAAAAQAAVKEALAAQPREPAPRDPALDAPKDALEEVLAPYIDKRANQSQLIALLASDKADFYTVDDPEKLAERLHFKDEIEKRALGLANVGRPMSRDDIFKHLKGEQEDKVQEFRGKRRKTREDAARGAEDLGGGVSMTRDSGLPRFVTQEQAHTLQGEGKLDPFLADKEF